MHFPSLTAIASDLLRGETDPVRLVEEALVRARSSSGIFIELFAEKAISEAEAARERRASGRARSRLDGIPIAWKDLFDIAGSRTTAGSLTRSDVPVAAADAAVVAASRRLGLIALGKTNLSEFAFSGLGMNPHFGTPTADFSVDEPRVPGGSSSGSAIAIQRGIVAAAIGTDTAGSVRVPAAFNGLVGFKTSHRRYDKAGVFPLADTFDSIGPLAATVADCAWLDAALRAEVEPTAATAADAPHFAADTALLDDPDLESAVRANLVAQLDRLAARGARVDFRPIEFLARTREAIRQHGWLGAAEALALHRDALASTKREQIDPCVVARLEAARSIGDDSQALLRALRRQLVGEAADELGGATLVMPTVKHVAPPLGPLRDDIALFTRTNLATLSLTMLCSFLDMPGLAIPSGQDPQGLPTSVLYSRPSGEEDELLSVGLWIEAAL